MKVAVVGSRDFDNKVMLQRILSRYKIDTIVSGGAKGADLMAKYYAFVSGMGYIEHLPDYKAYPGKVAPIMRNRLIVDDSDMVIAFWDMQSRGTKNTIEYAMKKSKEIVIVNTNTGRDYSFQGEGEIKTVQDNSLFHKMLNTQKIVKSYLKGEISLSELESKGIEV